MKLLLVLCKGFEHMESAPFIDIFGWARSYLNSDVEVVTCGFNESVTSTFGVSVNVDKTIDEIHISEYDALAIPGGFGEYGFYEEAYDTDFLGLIRTFDKAGKPIASVCVGSKPLGKAGILKGKKATTYHLDNKKHQKQLAAFEGVTVIPDESVVIDGNIITSFCPETAPQVSFELLAILKGQLMADDVKKLMGF